MTMIRHSLVLSAPRSWVVLLVAAVWVLPEATPPFVEARFDSLTERERVGFALADAARADALEQERAQRKRQEEGGGECSSAEGHCHATTKTSSTSYPHQHETSVSSPPIVVEEDDDEEVFSNDEFDDEECTDSIGTEACLELAGLVEHDDEDDESSKDMNHMCIRLFGATRHQCRKTCHLCGDYKVDVGLQTLYSDEPQVFVDPRDVREPTEEEIDLFFELLGDIDEYMFDQVYRNEHNEWNDLRFTCRNRHSACTAWAAQGECDANPGFMQVQCAPSCRSCAYLEYDKRCPPQPTAPNAWSRPGDIDRMFTRIVNDPDVVAAHRPTILAQPNPPKGGDILQGPWVVTLDHFLNATECQTFIELGAKMGYARSEDVGEMQFDGTYGSVQSSGRTSTNAWCDNECWTHPTTQEVHRRMEQLLHISPQNYEHLQLLKYEHGQFYEVHHDFIEHDIDRQAGPRILTVFIYLNDLDESQGGGTNFPRLQNMTVTPKQGRVLLWPSVLDSDPMQIDDRTHHQALPVLDKNAVKYGANAWVHQRDFKTPHEKGCV